jgi:uncharacterized protein YggE
MKKKLTYITVLLVLAVILTACAPATAAQPMEHTLNVNGTGKVQVIPDMASITVGVYSEGLEAVDVVAENNEKTGAIITALQELNIAEEDVRTANFNVFPQQQWDENGKRSGVIYIVQNSVVVTVRELDQLGNILDAVVNSGANDVSNIYFESSEYETYYQEALQLAVENARERADVLAGAAQVLVEDVLSINSYMVYGGGMEVPVARAAYDAGGGGMGVPVASGEMTIQVEVNATYIIK